MCACLLCVCEYVQLHVRNSVCKLVVVYTKHATCPLQRKAALIKYQDKLEVINAKVRFLAAISVGGGTNGTQSKSTARQCMFHSFLPLPAFFFVPLCHRLLCGCLQEEDELAELEAKAKLEAKLKLHRVSLSSKLMPILLCVCACALCVRVRCTPLGL